MEIITRETGEEFVRTAVQWIIGTILQAQHNGRTAIVGLSGGSTPKPVYVLLSTERSIDWKRVKFFLVDDRYVPPDHEESNQRMLQETLLTHEAVAAQTVFPDTTRSLPDCITEYNSRLTRLLPDLVILGMGDDGHIASLFPPVAPEAHGPAHVVHTTTETFAIHDRISVTFPVLHAAKKRLFLITGEKKASLLKKIQKENEDVSLYPAQMLLDEKTTWIIG